MLLNRKGAVRWQVEGIVERLMTVVSLGNEFKDGTRTKSGLWALAAKLTQALTTEKDIDVVVQALGDIIG